MPKKNITKAEKDDLAIVWSKHLIDTARRQGFYGKLIINFEAGIPTRIENHQSLKPPES